MNKIKSKNLQSRQPVSK